MTNVVVARKRNIHVSTNATAGIIDSTVPVTLKNTPTLISGNTNLKVENLTNVQANNEANGTTLVYDSNTKTWVAQYLTFQDVVGDLDGGTF